MTHKEKIIQTLLPHIGTKVKKREMLYLNENIFPISYDISIKEANSCDSDNVLINEGTLENGKELVTKLIFNWVKTNNDSWRLESIE